MLKKHYLPNTLPSQIIRFFIVGMITFGLDMVTLVILTEYYQIYYLTSAAFGFIVGSTLNYVLCVLFVFHSGRFKRKTNEFITFIILTFLGLLLNHAIMYLGHGALLINYKWVKIASLVIVTFFNFFSKKYIVFLK